MRRLACQSAVALRCNARGPGSCDNLLLPGLVCQRRAVAGSRVRVAPVDQGPQQQDPPRPGEQIPFGSQFLQEARREQARRQNVRLGTIEMDGEDDTAKSQQEDKHQDEDVEMQNTRAQLKRLFKDLPGHASLTTAYLLHCRGKLEPKVSTPLDEEDFEKVFMDERAAFRRNRTSELFRKRRKRRNYMQLNTGYEEPEETFEAIEEEFGADWRTKSIAEDVWKAEYYQHLHRKAYKDVPESGPLASRSDRLADVTSEAFRKHLLEQNRPVLTHELADFENPYMMKRSALERLLQERCVRNQLDERCLPRLLDKQPDLVKLRAQAPLPPEVLEPLAAFRGDVRWHFDARQRLAQKLDGASTALDAVVNTGGDGDKVASSLPENVPVDPNQVQGVFHPWRNHVGFESAVPRGMAGGTKFGQPMPALDAEVLRLRYPTLQRVAHTLPADPKWRAHVARTVSVLERSKDWDFKSKLDAVNRLKEVYDQMRPSEEYTADLDEKLPLNRVPSHLKRKYARDKQYVKTFPKRFLIKKSFTIYRKSLTSTTQLKISPAKMNFK